MQLTISILDKVCLPKDKDHVDADTLCWIGGYGSLSSPFPPIQRNMNSEISETEVIIMSDKNCRRSELSSSGFVWNVHFCADFLRKDPEIACRGDLGGPLICIENSTPVLYGVTSIGENCGETNYPAVYAKLSQYTDWIEEIINAAIDHS